MRRGWNILEVYVVFFNLILLIFESLNKIKLKLERFQRIFFILLIIFLIEKYSSNSIGVFLEFEIVLYIRCNRAKPFNPTIIFWIVVRLKRSIRGLNVLGLK